MKNKPRNLKSSCRMALLTTVLISILTFTGCAAREPDFITVETFDDIIPSTLSMSEDYAYLRIVLSRERLNELIDLDFSGEIYLEPGGNIASKDDNFTVKITHEEIGRLISTLDQTPEQKALAVVKPVSIDNSDLPEYPENLDYIVYAFLTPEDSTRYLTEMASKSADTFIFRQRLNPEGDDIKKLSISLEGLVTSIVTQNKTTENYVIYIIFVGKTPTTTI